MVTLELPYPPSVNSIWRRGRNRRTKKPVVYLDKKYAAWKVEADGWFMQQRSKKTVGDPVMGPFEAHLAFSTEKRRKGSDLDNRIKCVMDFLQGVGLIENDSKCEKLTATWAPCDGVFLRVFKYLDTSASSNSKTT